MFPEVDKVAFHFLEQSAIICGSLRVDNIENSFSRNDKSVAKSLAFWSVFTRLVVWIEPLRILARIVARLVTDNVRSWRRIQYQRFIVVFFELLIRILRHECQFMRLQGLTENQVSHFAKGLLPINLPTIAFGINPGALK